MLQRSFERIFPLIGCKNTKSRHAYRHVKTAKSSIGIAKRATQSAYWSSGVSIASRIGADLPLRISSNLN